MSKTIGDNIQTIRMRLNLGQEELADKLGVEQSYVSGIESGARPDLKASTVKRFAKALGCTPNELYEGAEFPLSPVERRRIPRGRK